jgi:hypothetical protein
VAASFTKKPWSPWITDANDWVCAVQKTKDPILVWFQTYVAGDVKLFAEFQKHFCSHTFSPPTLIINIWILQSVEGIVNILLIEALFQQLVFDTLIVAVVEGLRHVSFWAEGQRGQLPRLACSQSGVQSYMDSCLPILVNSHFLQRDLWLARSVAIRN